MNKMNKKNLLIEVYTEELPLGCVESFFIQLPEVTKNILEKNKFEYKNLTTYVTPVRLIIYIEELSEFTKKEEQEILGPSVNVAIKDGSFTQAAFGFVKRYEIDIKNVYIKETEKGKFIAIKKICGGQEIVPLIPKILYEILTSVSYPKQMAWEENFFRFPRPIRNLLVIFGNQIIKTKFLSLTSSNYTYGIKTFPLKKIKITSKKHLSLAESYFEILKDEGVIFDSNKRLDSLKKAINNITAKRNMSYEEDENLLNQIISMVEYPTCVLCEFPERFLRLPLEFIVVCMKTKQKFIPLYDLNGKLLNKFIGVKNGFSEYLDNVKNGYEKVLMARLEDVNYYYEIDRKVSFDSRFEKLKEIVFNSKLDSLYYDKVKRIEQLAIFLNEKLNFEIDEEIIKMAAKLIKNDLTTQIVYEYPELQGVAGRIYCSEYCKENNLPEEFSLCCEEHYLPKNYDDRVPQNKLSVLFSLSNKISDVIDMAIVGNLPTGSSDPYGVKKIADGVIKISKELKIDLNLKDVIEFYLKNPITRTSLNNQQVIWDFPNVRNDLINFFLQRFSNILENEGFKVDEIRVVLYDFNGEFYTKSLILQTIKNFRSKSEFIKLIEMYKRLNNILIQAKNKNFELNNEINQQLFIFEEEKELYNKLVVLENSVEEKLKEKDFKKSIEILLEFKPIVDKFFDKVLVFDQNKDIAENRLSTLNKVLSIFRKIGYFEYIQI